MISAVRFTVPLLFVFQFSLASSIECKYFYGNDKLKLATEILTLPTGTARPELLAKVQESLGLDEINFKYLQVLMKAYGESKKSTQTNSVLVIADRHNLAEALGKTSMVVPTAIASSDLMRSVPVTNYSKIMSRKSEYESVTTDVKFWVKKLMAGTGSGIVRVEFLKDIYQKLGKSGSIKIGSKGTDLHAEVIIDGQSHILNIAELQILQLLAQSEKYRQVIFHDVVSNETQSSIAATWSKPSSVLGGKTLAEVANVKGDVRSGPTVQFHIPTIDSAGYLTRERSAPAGHGLFAIEAIDATLRRKLPQTKNGEKLIGIIGNGEDLMSTPSQDIIGWMAKENLPLVMVTTEKTNLDKQGGQIAIGFNSKGQEYVTIVEKAQAETAAKNGFPEQTDLFFKLGLRPTDNKAMFNTNMVLVNYNALQPKLLKLAGKVGGNDKLLERVAPDLITNTKTQVGVDGIKKSFVQLEGAMGSVVLKLDRLYRENFDGEPLVHFLNIEKDHRTEYFAPIKTAFDFFMQFYSDRFIVDGQAFKIIDQRPGSIPKVTLADEFYKEAANTLNAFKDTKILELDELTIDGFVKEDKTVSGTVLLPGMKLVGTVRIKNLSGRPVNLPMLLKQNSQENKTLKNVSVVIDAQGGLAIETINQ
ncbi:MAG: UTP--glucose-1-phosphate uridylyltransferase [Bdellovibrionaceae bacterium]|nr:UTP--glucose-1-phosphate uridylyltransferase [Pseudobdellovibrionaceae bacterium]